MIVAQVEAQFTTVIRFRKDTLDLTKGVENNTYSS